MLFQIYYTQFIWKSVLNHPVHHEISDPIPAIKWKMNHLTNTPDKYWFYTLSHLKNDCDVSAYSWGRHLYVFSRVQKGTQRLTHKGCVLQRASLGAISDVTVVLGMRQSIDLKSVFFQRWLELFWHTLYLTRDNRPKQKRSHFLCTLFFQVKSGGRAFTVY